MVKTLTLTWPSPHPTPPPADFGTAPELLFQPCDVNDDQCFIGGEGRTFKFDPLIRLPTEALKEATADDRRQPQQTSFMAASL